MNVFKVISCLFFLISSPFGSVSTLSCRNELNNPVEWIYIYKLPKHVSSTGLDYLFLHKNSHGWQLPANNRTIDDPLSVPGTIISQLTGSDLVIMYNDEPPGEKTDNVRGHTKGVVAGNGEEGFWLIHSVPKYPDSDYSTYSYPPTGHLYGQSFLCISMAAKDLEAVGSLIQFNEPHIYLGQVPEQLKTIYPRLAELVKQENNNWITEPPFYKTELIGEFTVYSKSRKFNKELYVDWVAPSLQTDLLVESWLHGPGVINSDCAKPFKVYNINEINLPNQGKEFKSMEDHSKWGVGRIDDWICVGDINRADHQKLRGGGTVCKQCPYVAKAYRALVENVYPCQKPLFRAFQN